MASTTTTPAPKASSRGKVDDGTTEQVEVGSIALREIAREGYSKATKRTVQSEEFARLVREITEKISAQGFQGASLERSQELVEMFLVSEVEMINMMAIHAQRDVILPEDIRAIFKMRKLMIEE